MRGLLRLSMVLSLGAVLAVACGPKHTDTQPVGGGEGGGGEAGGGEANGGGGEAGGGESGGGAAKGWAALSKAEKKEIMKKKVVPRMRELFKESPEPDIDVDCSTCHGDRYLDGNFDMPNPDLAVLDFSTGMADIKAKPDGQAWLDFMNQKMKPTMAELLGLPEMSQEHPDGLGCLTCHTKK